jgi:hypothetical protein
LWGRLAPGIVVFELEMIQSGDHTFSRAEARELIRHEAGNGFWIASGADGCHHS